MHANRITRRRIRFVMLALIVVLGAFWAGARYGPRTPAAVEAVPASATPSRLLRPPPLNHSAPSKPKMFTSITKPRQQWPT